MPSKVILFIFLIIFSPENYGILPSDCTAASTSSSTLSYRQSHDFILPDVNEELGRKCQRFSDYFCLMAVWLNTRLTNREPQQDDAEQFRKLVEPNYKNLNWYSFRENDISSFSEGCCSHQVDSYIQYGQKNGLSPQEYYDKVFKIGRVTDKQLVFLKARWVPSLCMNVINQVGFGYGSLKIIGNPKLSRNFIVPPVGNEDLMMVVPKNQVKDTLSFSWFLVNLVCREKPHWCPEEWLALQTAKQVAVFPAEPAPERRPRRNLAEMELETWFIKENNESAQLIVV
ncbi:uncharacterized protein LOC134856913 [Symsagittifera roscoffensis]|uniref:uncharacterized protein LOC134856913 n=1 Tax=Symsagittifera roscoffensis TaxID=84072 RepID=UPI00307C64FB